MLWVTSTKATTVFFLIIIRKNRDGGRQSISMQIDIQENATGHADHASQALPAPLVRVYPNPEEGRPLRVTVICRAVSNTSFLLQLAQFIFVLKRKKNLTD